MPEILSTNVKITADASKLKKEAKESVKALEEIQDKQHELSEDTRLEIQSMVDEYNRLQSNLQKMSGAAYEKGKFSKWSKEVVTNLEASIARVKDSLASFTSDIPTNQLSEEVRNILGRELEVAPVQVPIEPEVKDDGIEKAKSKLDDLNKKINKIKENWKTAFSGKSVNGIARVGLALMGIRSMFTAIRKAMNTYLAQNDKLRQKLDGIWYALGSLFAPILEWLVNLFAKLLLYLNAFLKGLGLAGIDFKGLSKSAEKTQKQMKKLISGFDELNVYTKDSQDAGSSFVNPFENVNVNQEWIEKLTKLGEKLRPIFEWLQKALSDLFNWISEHIGLVLGLIGTIMAIGLIAKIGEIIRNLKVVWDLLKVVGEAIMTFLTSPLGGVVLIIAGLVTAVAAFVDMWKNGWNIIGEILKDLGIALVAIGAIILGAPAAITALIAGIVAALSTLVIVVHEHWDEIVAWTKQLWKSLGELWEKIKVDCVDLWNRLGSWLSEKWSSLVTGVKDKWTQMKTAASELTHALGEALAKDWETIKSNLGNMWNSIKSMAASVWQGISTTVINIVHALGNALQSAWNGIKSFTQSIWNGITGVIKGAINGIIGLINGMIRGLTNGINAVINLLNKFSVTIPSWVPGFGGKHFGFNLRTLTAPQIPTLANGGVITAPTLAMMGEYAGANRNPEIATPQRLLENIIDKRNSELVSSFAEMTNQIISAISDVNMEVKIGDETIARSAARGNDNYFRLTGSPLFV